MGIRGKPMSIQRHITNLIVLPGLLSLLLIAACTNEGSMPTRPSVGAISPWSKIYPEISCQNLTKVWGLDADDMWISSNYGYFLHYDGQSFKEVPSDNNYQVLQFEGSATHDVYALTSGRLFHWDGDAWATLYAHGISNPIMCLMPTGDLYLGGSITTNEGQRAILQHYNGSRWSACELPYASASNVDHLWQPGPGRPLLASLDDSLYRLIDGEWADADFQNWPISIERTDGNLAVARRWMFEDRMVLHFDDSGLPYEKCEDVYLGECPSRIVDSRVPLFKEGSTLRGVFDCEVQTVNSQLFEINDLTMPVRPGPNGPAIFAVGLKGKILRGVWNTSGLLQWNNMNDGMTMPASPQVEGDADRLFTYSRKDLIIQDGEGWHSEPSLSNIRWIQPLSDDRLAIAEDNVITIRQQDGTRHSLTESPDYVSPIWTDGEHALGVKSYQHQELWSLDSGLWTIRDSIPQNVHQISTQDGITVFGRQYSDVGYKLLTHDGEDWSVVPLPSDLVLESWVQGEKSGMILASFRHPDDYYDQRTYTFHHDAWTKVADTSTGLDHRFVQELEPGHFLVLGWDHLIDMSSEGWQMIAERSEDWPSDISSCWAHPDQGIICTDYRGNIHRTDYPTR